MNYSHSRALELLRLGTGKTDATFRTAQDFSISYIVENKGRLLLIQKTGWGKSFVYFIATKLLREAGAGPALLISPLLSLMRNQISAAKRMGVRAATINSANHDDWDLIKSRLYQNEVDILLITPERLSNDLFNTEVLGIIADRISLLIIDEAHCISDWGHDFRPHYRLLERIIRKLPPSLRLLATTATANKRVIDDLLAVLGSDIMLLHGDLNRESLTLQTIRLPSKAERMAWLVQQLFSLKGHGIIYTLTVRDAELLADWLKTLGFAVEAYTSKSKENREALEQALLDNELKALVATTALGMGFDKPDLSFVIHFQRPGSVIAYYQQVGRAGRALDSAYGVLLSGDEEEEIVDYFINSAFPTRQEVKAVLDALDRSPEGLSKSELMAHVNMSLDRIEKTVTALSLESPAPIVKQSSKWQLTSANLADSFWDRAERLTQLREIERKQMQEYVNLPFGQHMGFLIKALDGDASSVTAPKLPPLPTSVDPEMVEAAVSFLNQRTLSIIPRKKWPALGMPQYGVLGNIPPDLQANFGKALCFWGEPGWGTMVREGKYRDRYFSDDLVDACVKMISDWEPDPSPAWVTCIPSLRHPELVPNFAQRLANSLGLPFHMVLKKKDARPEQKTMVNSLLQAMNIDGSLAINDIPILPGPVLLIDDMVHSRWTITVAAWLLRKNGSGMVFPMALALTGYEE